MITEELAEMIMGGMKQSVREEFLEAITRIVKRPTIRIGTQEDPNVVHRSFSEMDYVLKVVSAKTGVSIEKIKSGSREGEICKARQLFCFVTRFSYPIISSPSIGATINRNHATVLHSIEVIENMICTRDYICDIITEIAEEMKNERLNKKIESIKSAC